MNKWLSALAVLSLMFTALTAANAAVEGFVEDCSGNGPYESFLGNYSGLNNPNWDMYGDGGELTPVGFRSENYPSEAKRSQEIPEFDIVERLVRGKGSFRETLRFHDVSMPERSEGFDLPLARISLSHPLDVPNSGSMFSVNVIQSGYVFDPFPETWRFGGTVDGFNADPGKRNAFIDVPPATEFDMGIEFDVEMLEFVYFFDNLNADLPADELGPYLFEGTFADPLLDKQFTSARIHAAGHAEANATLYSWKLDPIGDIFGDFDADGILTTVDIDLLSAAIRQATDDLQFDVTYDKSVDEFDRVRWLQVLVNTYFGDSNLDGEFNSSDLVAVFVASQYEDNVDGNSTWATGDWNGDGDFNSRDLVIAFQDGGYEQGTRANVNSVPEPEGVSWLVFWVLLLRDKRRAGSFFKRKRQVARPAVAT